jgi:hypothetical protein
MVEASELPFRLLAREFGLLHTAHTWARRGKRRNEDGMWRLGKEGLLGLEDVYEKEQDGFVRRGLQLLVDGSEPETIRHVLEVEMENREHLDMQAAKMFEGMGGYTPTIGIIGAVMGLSLRGLPLDVYGQMGLLVLSSLAAMAGQP